MKPTQVLHKTESTPQFSFSCSLSCISAYKKLLVCLEYGVVWYWGQCKSADRVWEDALIHLVILMVSLLEMALFAWICTSHINPPQQLWYVVKPKQSFSFFQTKFDLHNKIKSVYQRKMRAVWKIPFRWKILLYLSHPL